MDWLRGRMGNYAAAAAQGNSLPGSLVTHGKMPPLPSPLRVLGGAFFTAAAFFGGAFFAGAFFGAFPIITGEARTETWLAASVGATRACVLQGRERREA